MYEILYVSAAARKLSDYEIHNLVEHAQTKNAKRRVTGILAYDRDSESFFQVLEGEERDIRAIYDRIVTDSRHQELRILHEGPRPDRRFGDWSMELVESAYFKAIVFENM